MGADCGIILGQPDETDPASYNKRWTVDIEQATTAITAFMA